MSAVPTSTGRPRGRPRKNQTPSFPGLQHNRQHQSTGASQPVPDPSTRAYQPMPDSPLAGNRPALAPLPPWFPGMKGPFEQQQSAQLKYTEDFAALCKTIANVVVNEENGMVLFRQAVELASDSFQINVANNTIHEGLMNRIVERSEEIKQLKQDLLEAKVDLVNANETLASMHHLAAARKHRKHRRHGKVDAGDDNDDIDDDAPGDDDVSFFPAHPAGAQGDKRGTAVDYVGEFDDSDAHMSGAGGSQQAGDFSADFPLDPALGGSYNPPIDPAFVGHFNTPVGPNSSLDPALGGSYNPPVGPSFGGPLNPPVGPNASLDPALHGGMGYQYVPAVHHYHLGNVFGNPAGNFPTQPSPESYEAPKNMPGQINFAGNQFLPFFNSPFDAQGANMQTGHTIALMPAAGPAEDGAQGGAQGGMIAAPSTNGPSRIRFASKSKSKRAFVYPKGSPSDQKRHRVKQRCDNCFIQHSRCPQEYPFAPCGSCAIAKIECTYTNIGRGEDGPLKPNHNGRKDGGENGPDPKKPSGSLELLPMVPSVGRNQYTGYSG